MQRKKLIGRILYLAQPIYVHNVEIWLYIIWMFCYASKIFPKMHDNATISVGV